MKTALVNKNSKSKNVSVEDLQQIFKNSPSVKKMREESERLLQKIQFPL